MAINETEICPLCNEREVAIDDMGFLGCQECWDATVSPEIKASIRQHEFDMDLTGQDEEAYYNRD